MLLARAVAGAGRVARGLSPVHSEAVVRLGRRGGSAASPPPPGDAAAIAEFAHLRRAVHTHLAVLEHDEMATATATPAVRLGADAAAAVGRRLDAACTPLQASLLRGATPRVLCEFARLAGCFGVCPRSALLAVRALCAQVPPSALTADDVCALAEAVGRWGIEGERVADATGGASAADVGDVAATNAEARTIALALYVARAVAAVPAERERPGCAGDSASAAPVDPPLPGALRALCAFLQHVSLDAVSLSGDGAGAAEAAAVLSAAARAARLPPNTAAHFAVLAAAALAAREGEAFAGALPAVGRAVAADLVDGPWAVSGLDAARASAAVTAFARDGAVLAGWSAAAARRLSVVAVLSSSALPFPAVVAALWEACPTGIGLGPAPQGDEAAATGRWHVACALLQAACARARDAAADGVASPAGSAAAAGHLLVWLARHDRPDVRLPRRFVTGDCAGILRRSFGGDDASTAEACFAFLQSLGGPHRTAQAGKVGASSAEWRSLAARHGRSLGHASAGFPALRAVLHRLPDDATTTATPT